MTRTLNAVMLIDDDPDEIFFHQREINKFDPRLIVIEAGSAPEALEYLETRKKPLADLIFLDINMPAMDGWEFLSRYRTLDVSIRNYGLIFMLSTSESFFKSPDPPISELISGILTKPLTRDTMATIREMHF